MSWTIEGDPIPKGRPRHGRSGHSFTPKRTSDAEQVIRDHVAGGDPVVPFDQPVYVTLDFYCRTRRRTDWDNLAKLVTDALNGIAYTDDHLIHRCLVRVFRAVADEVPRTVIRVRALS